MEDSKNCPEFPHFGASYPDATCVDGYLWDLNSYDGEGYYASGGDDPCPFCNTEEYIEFFIDDDTSRKDAEEYIKKLRERYKGF